MVTILFLLGKRKWWKYCRGLEGRKIQNPFAPVGYTNNFQKDIDNKLKKKWVYIPRVILVWIAETAL